jgi:hypothetical protein
MSRLKPKKAARALGRRPTGNCLPVADAVPSWQPHLSQYAEQRILTFRSPKDLDAAIDLLWTEELRSLPHATPDGKSLVVPADAVGYFARAGLRFTARKVLSIRDLSVEEIRRLRR